MWVVSEIAAMATDLAEFLGATIGLALLAGLPLLAGAAIVAVATYGMLQLQRFGFRPLEIIIAAFLGTVGLAYLIEIALSRPEIGEVAAGFVPTLDGTSSATLAVGIVGATVMPHAIYIHSSLTQQRVRPRNTAQAEEITRLETVDVLLALGLAGLVNLAMLAMAAAVFHTSGHADVAQIETAYQTLAPLLGTAAAGIFLVSLLISGLSSAVVGTMAGQVIMQGFVGFQVPLWLRRLLTMLPALAVIAWGVNPTQALVLSQVALSLSLPAPLIALVVLTSRRDVMGRLANSRPVTILACTATAVIVALNGIYVLASAGLGG